MNNLRIDEQEQLYIDGVKLQKVRAYVLKHSADLPAELTVTMDVVIAQAEPEPLQKKFDELIQKYLDNPNRLKL